MYKIKTSPLFSIVIPVYRRRNLAAQATKSIIRQKGVSQKNIEIIVSDDEDNVRGCHRNRVFFKKLAKNIIYVKNRNKEGPGGNRQTGLEVSKGEYVVFLDSDDRLTGDFMSLMSSFIKNGDYSAAVCFSQPAYDPGFNLAERIKLIPLTVIRDISLWTGYFFNNKCLYTDAFYLCQFSHMIFKRKNIEYQKFNYNYRYGGEDWDFFVQTLKKGRIGILPRKLLLFRYSPGSSTDEPLNRIKKWKSYLLLTESLPKKFKKGVFYYLLLSYIYIFGRKYAEK